MTDIRPSVLVIGAGMYVGGRGAGTDGTVLAALMQAQSQGIIGEILVAATTRKSVTLLQEKLNGLNSRLGTQVRLRGYPTGEDPDSRAYLKALEDLPRPACAIVVVPDHLHASITADVIRAGVHPLVVKPLTPTVYEAQELIELADKYNVYGAVEFHKRWDESNLLLREALADGQLGDIRYVTVEYSQRRIMRSIFQSWLEHTNIFQYLGVHYADLVYFLTGSLPIRALATAQPGSLVPSGLCDSEAIQAMVEWENPESGERFVSTIITSWIDPDTTSAMSDQKINVVGTKGRYQLDQKQRGAQLVTGLGGVEDVNPYFSQIYRGVDGVPGVHGYGPRSIIQFLIDVSDLVNGTIQREDLIAGHRPSFKDCLISTAIIEAVNLSLALDSQWVQIGDIELESASSLSVRSASSKPAVR